ncbi:helix-turn-helix transcriptional regulator [Paenibacillus cellulosilyticus]|nr:helix-turn-helix transcriptional regulator [Paenibacillus cellulosilyticus]
MAYLVEELAHALVTIPLEVHGVYRTELEPGVVYDGHVDRPTTKCAVIISLRGQADFIYDETERYRLEPGKILIGGVQKRLEIHTSKEGFEYALVHYLPQAIAGKEEMKRLTEVSLLHASPDPGLMGLFDQLLQSASSPDRMMELEKKALFYRLIHKLLQAERHQQNSESYTLIDQAIQYIQSHYAEPLTLDQLAGSFGLKPKYFSSLFHRYVGLGPIDYLIQFRINRAHELLMTGQFTVAAVARSVGYADAYYFSRLFKKHKGLPPGQVGLHRKRNSPS